mgnify:CR=1 FL=1
MDQDVKPFWFWFSGWRQMSIALMCSVETKLGPCGRPVLWPLATRREVELGRQRPCHGWYAVFSRSSLRWVMSSTGGEKVGGRTSASAKSEGAV